MVISLTTAQAALLNDNVIQLTNIYSYSSPKYWRLTKSINIILSNGKHICIPEGFETDLSSVPMFGWGLLHPYGDFLLAAIIHDYLYHTKMWTRKESDKEMFIWSKKINKEHWYNKVDNHVRYYAVRLFGWIVWNS